jgi:hypothetical protein
MGKLIQWKVVESRLEWRVDEEKLAAEAALDSCYVIKITVAKEQMSQETVVARYQSLSRD